MPCSREDIDSLSKTKKGWTSTVTSSSSSAAAGRAKASGRAKKDQTVGAGKSLGPSGKARSSLEFERDWRRIGAADQDRRYR